MFLLKLQKICANTLRAVAVFLILFYQKGLSTILGTGGSCRFEPSCSEYALECFKNMNFIDATIYTLRRLLRCRPFGPFGEDPAPRGIKHEL